MADIKIGISVDGRKAISEMDKAQQSAVRLAEGVGQATVATHELEQQSKQYAAQNVDVVRLLNDSKTQFEQMKKSVGFTTDSLDGLNKESQQLNQLVKDVARSVGIESAAFEEITQNTRENTTEIAKNGQEQKTQATRVAGLKKIMEAHQASLRNELSETARLLRQGFNQQQAQHEKQLASWQAEKTKLQETIATLKEAAKERDTYYREQIRLLKENQRTLEANHKEEIKALKEAQRERDNAHKEQLKNIREMQAEAKNASSSFENLRGIMQGLFAGFTVRSLLDTSAQFQSLQQELKLVAYDGESTAQTLQNLFAVANSSRQPIDAAVSAFSTLKKSTQNLNLSEEQLLSITDTVTKAIAIGGSNAMQASNSMIQFSQALALGKLSGQNFNSVAEQTPGLVQAIAAGLGMSTAQIKVFANDGKLSTEQIITALQNASDTTDATFQKLSLTIEGSLTQLKNNFMNFIGTHDAFSEKIANGIALISNNMDLLAVGIGTVILAVMGYKAQNYYQSLLQTQQATVQTAAAQQTLRDRIVGATSALTFANAKAAAGSLVMNGFKGSVLAAGFAWKTFTAMVKSTGLGLVLSGILYVVGKIVEYIYDMIQTWRGATTVTNEFIDSTQSLEANVANLNKQLSNEVAAREELIKKRDSEIAQLNHMKELSAKVGQAFVDTHSRTIQAIDKEIKARDTLINKIQVQLSLLDNKATNLTLPTLTSNAANQAVSSYNQIASAATKASKKVSGAAKSTHKPHKEAKEKVDHYKKALEDLNNQLSEVQATYMRLTLGQDETLTKLDEVNLKIKQQAEGYTNVSEKDLNALKQVAMQIDLIHAKQLGIKQTVELQGQIDKQRLENSLIGMQQAQQDRALLMYDRELQLKQALKGLDQESASSITAYYQQLWALQDEHSARLEEQKARQSTFYAQLKEGIQSQIPTLQTFAQTASQAFGTFADGIADATLGAKVDFAEMTREILRNIVKMIVKMAVLQGAIMLGDWLTGGALSAVLSNLKNTSNSLNQLTSLQGALQLIKGMMGFSSGGYTGDVPTNAPAGIVHGQEFVINAQSTRKYGVSMLEQINRGAYEPQEQEYVQPKLNVIINNYAGVNVHAQQTSKGLVLTIEEVKSIAQETALDVMHSVKYG